VGYYLRQKFGDQVNTEFINLAASGNRDHYSSVVQAVKQHNLPLPIVAINGEVKVAGGVDYYAVARAVESILGAANPA